ncbi:NAD(P)-dependent oxidoreductase [Listeria goaensis]|uniref:NAD(P)-dependent oxidoreductase n=1 Tax=Listeria goaensis TaxID=1649188 RepID=UPI000B5929C1|nr:NAD(P)-dependent oxidoreductase [Listeria goaensis]
MKILYTLTIPEDWQVKQQEAYPNDIFYYEKEIKNFKELNEVDCIVTYGGDITAEIIEAASALKWIMVFSAGVDGLPKQAILEKNILVSNVRGIHAVSMAEFVLSYLLHDVKQLQHFYEAQKKKEWAFSHPVVELGNKEIVVAGAGAIGSQIAKFAKMFGMQTVGLNTTGQPVEGFDKTFAMRDLKQVIRAADYFVSVLPKTKETTGVYDEDFFHILPKSAVFINIGRGNAIESAILEKVIAEKTIRHFYLDVYPEEPLATESPIWTATNVTMTPHVSGHTDQYINRSMEIWLDSLEKFKAGKTVQNEINLNRGY